MTDPYRNIFPSADSNVAIIEVVFDKSGKSIGYRFVETNQARAQSTSAGNGEDKKAKEIVPEAEDFWIDLYEDVVRTGIGRRFEHHHTGIQAGGWYSGYACPFGEPGENRVAVLFNDVSSQKKSTEALSGQVNHRTTALERSYEDLRHFAHAASHDLKEPIRKIRTFTNRLIEEFPVELTDKMRSYLQKIDASSLRMLTLIDVLLNYSKAEYAQLHPEAVNLNDVVKQVTSELELVIQQKNMRIELATLPVISANATLMYRMFYNLLLNSLKFCRTDIPCRVQVSSEKIEKDQHTFYRLVVSDNGIGFDPKFAGDIFKPFFKLHAADEYEGTGLGLALCKKIAERYNGTISAYSKPGEGASFSLLLPAEPFQSIPL